MAHTHLVKGLDYALLQQQRMKQQAAAAGEKVEKAAAAAAPAQTFGAPLTRAKEAASFVGSQGRALYAALFSQPTAHQRAAAVRESFLPRRLAFVYELDGGGAAGELPTTLRRSQADCPPAPDLLPAGADGQLLARVGRVMEYVAANLMGKGGQRKPKKKEHAEAIKVILAGGTPAAAAAAAAAQDADDGAAAAAAAAKAAAVEQQQQQQQQQQRPVDSDDDIFGDAGTDYVPDIPVKPKESAAAAAAAGR
jgi:IK cytokine